MGCWPLFSRAISGRIPRIFGESPQSVEERDMSCRREEHISGMAPISEETPRTHEPARERWSPHQALQLHIPASPIVWVVQLGALKPQHHAMLPRARTKMLRNMAGWRRAEGESWQDTMRRMQARVSNMPSTAASPDVSERVLSFKWRLARRLFCGDVRKWAPILRHLPSAHKRARGRPPLQWSDDINQFCTYVGADFLEQTLQAPVMEKQDIEFCMKKL